MPTVNDSLNAPKEHWGLPLPVLMIVFGIAGLLGYFGNTFLGVAVAIGIPLLSKRAVSLDPRIYRLALLSLNQKAYYDPGKRR
jgi:hypothetical protein